MSEPDELSMTFQIPEGKGKEFMKKMYDEALKISKMSPQEYEELQELRNTRENVEILVSWGEKIKAEITAHADKEIERARCYIKDYADNLMIDAEEQLIVHTNKEINRISNKEHWRGMK